jgi:flagellar basal-body rod protein FlgB
MLDHLFGDSVHLLERSLELRMTRQNLIASNIANAETPGYRALDMDFESMLREIVQARKTEGASGATEESLAAQRASVRLIHADAPSLANENNTVLLERELGKLSKNALMFKAQAQILGQKLNLLREAASAPG